MPQSIPDKKGVLLTKITFRVGYVCDHDRRSAMPTYDTRRRLIARIDKLQKRLETVKHSKEKNKEWMKNWKRRLRWARAKAVRIKDREDLSISLVTFGVPKRIMTRLGRYKVSSFETLGNIETVSLRKEMRDLNDRLLVTILVQLHPSNSKQ